MSIRLRAVAALVTVTLFVACLRVGAAHAQAAGTPPDIVRTKNGGLLRGTIVELVPGAQVTLLGADGQTRKLPMADVAYAGPVAKDPLAAPEPAPPPPQAAPPPLPSPAAVPPLQLRLLADEPDITYHYLASTSHGVGMGVVGGHVAAVGVTMNNFKRLCTAPCTTSLEAGSYTFAIERQGGGLVRAPVMTIQGSEELKAHYVSRSGLRWGLFLTGVALATVGFLVGMQTKHVCADEPSGGTDAWGQPILINSCDDDYPHLAPGMVMFSVGLTSMVVPLLIHDSAEIAATGR